MDKKKVILLGFALVLAFVFAISLYSQQVTAQQPLTKKPQFATIEITKVKTTTKGKSEVKVKGIDGEESLVMLYTDTQKEKFLQDYKTKSSTVPLVLEITLSPTKTYYALVCRTTGGVTVCK